MFIFSLSCCRKSGHWCHSSISRKINLTSFWMVSWQWAASERQWKLCAHCWQCTIFLHQTPGGYRAHYEVYCSFLLFSRREHPCSSEEVCKRFNCLTVKEKLSCWPDTRLVLKLFQILLVLFLRTEESIFATLIKYMNGHDLYFSAFHLVNYVREWSVLTLARLMFVNLSKRPSASD